MMASDASLSRIKNKSAAAIQVSHEQLLREATERGGEEKKKKSTPVFTDLEELSEWQGRQRAEFEKYVRIANHNINNFTRYAQFELEQKDYRRARSVFERALEIHPTDIRVWMRYVDAELAGKNIGHARNLLDRAVTILPRVKKLWLKYAFVEEKLGNLEGVRQVFERWLQWEPDADAWGQAIKFETKYEDWDRARSIFERMVYVHPEPNSWIKWARFEVENGTSDLVRDVFSQAIETLGEDFMSEKIFIEYARFEVRLKEIERARAIYKFALDRLPRSKSIILHKAYTTFEKQFGDSEGVEDVVLEKRRVQYEDEVRREPRNYDAWLDLARLEETGGDWDKVRDAYERAIAQVPPTDNEKRHWRRYIYLWLFYATWEELTTKDMERVAQIYQALLKMIPHKKWTSAKAWLNFALFRVRQMQLTDARKILGTAIGKCPKSKLFKEYIHLEIRLYEFDRARMLYEKYVVWDPSNTETWKAWAEMERGLTDNERARMILEAGVSEDVLDRPEMLWKEYIDFETELEKYDLARELYERLLLRAPHIKVWTSYAQFESSTSDAEDELDAGSLSRIRAVFERAIAFFKREGRKEERAQMLSQWKVFEKGYGSAEEQQKVEKMLPNRVKKRRKLDDENYEEYMDWVFPDEKEGNNLSGLLAMAQKWKQAKE